MAKGKSDVGVLVRGLGMGMAFLQALTEEIVAAGGFEEMIHFLTKERARPICKKIAEMVVKSKWQIPRSLMEQLVVESGEVDANYLETDKRYRWEIVLGIIKFGEGLYASPGASAVPQLVLNQIEGKKAAYPMIVQWENEPHVVVNNILEGGDNSNFQVGEMVEKGTVKQLFLSPAKYFNLDQ